jgi:hypothetical protein
MTNAHNLIENDPEFLVDMARVADGCLTPAQAKRKWRHISEDTWQRLGTDDDLVERIEAEKIRRIRDGSTKRERAQQAVIEAPGVLGGIMLDGNASPRHRVDAAKALDGLAANGPQNVPMGERFTITINLGTDVEHFSKSIAIDPNDTAPAPLIETGAKDEDGNGGVA